MNRSEAEMSEIRRVWKEKQYDQVFYDKSDLEQAKELGVSRVTIWNWKKAESPHFWEMVKAAYRQNSHQEIVKIDRAMFKAAQSGDVGAAKLVYERIEGWSPKQINENLNRSGDLKEKTDIELLKETLRGASPELLMEVLAEKRVPEAPKVVEGGDKTSNG